MGLGGRRICFQQDGVNGCRAMAHLALDKAAAAVYEGIAIAKIEEWYRDQGQKIHARYNEENGLEAKRRFDLIDTYGKKWEVKTDRIWSTTGNIFFEHYAIKHSEADFFIILAGFAYILPRETALQLLEADYRTVQGRDDLRFTGTLVPVSALEELADVV
jgi:hypothetical protein